MTITRRVSLSITVLLILMVVMGAVGLGAELWIGSWTSDYNVTLAQSEEAAAISEASANMVIYGVAEITAVEMTSRDQFDAKRLEDRAEVVEALDTLAGLGSTDAEEAAALDNLRSIFDECDQTLEATVALALKGANGATQALVDVRGDVLPLAGELDEAANSYRETKQVQSQAALDNLNGTERWMMIGIALVVALGIVVGVVLGARMSRRIRRQLGAAVSGINTSAAELLAVASQVAASAAQTATATHETTATVEEVKQTAQLASEKASLVAESSQNVASVAGAERATVEDTIAAFERMQAQMAVVGDTINRLSEQTQTVGDIITTVSDLAEQSNLLSVNASIEAAKAGEQGKGFTVVAQEVKSLATQSKQAVTQVRAILSEIQKASGLAVEAADQSRETIEAGRHQIREAGEGTIALADSATEAAQSAVQISASSRQQLAGMEQISQAIDSISQAGSESAEGTRQVEREVKNLQDLALGLNRLVDAKATASA